METSREIAERLVNYTRAVYRPTEVVDLIVRGINEYEMERERVRARARRDADALAYDRASHGAPEGRVQQ